jgi:hypothetical protein
MGRYSKRQRSRRVGRDPKCQYCWRVGWYSKRQRSRRMGRDSKCQHCWRVGWYSKRQHCWRVGWYSKCQHCWRVGWYSKCQHCWRVSWYAKRESRLPNMNSTELLGDVLTSMNFGLILVAGLPYPFLILVKMSMSSVPHRPHGIRHLGQSSSHNYRRDYCFHNNSEGTTL